MRELEAHESLDAATVEKLVEHHRKFLSFLEQRVGSRAEAEDLLQEAFVRGVEHLGSLRSEESALAWFYRTLRNTAIDYYRRRGASGRALLAFSQELDAASEPAREMRETVCSCVRALSETLKPEYADALKRIDVEGMSVQGYAAEVGIAANNAGMRVHRAREALRKRVIASCGSCAEHGCLSCSCGATSSGGASGHAP